MPEMRDEEIICQFMEPRPEHPPYSWQSQIEWGRPTPGGWWYADSTVGVHGHWRPCELTLDRLRLVEARLTDEQWDLYRAILTIHSIWTDRHLIHLAPDQKVKALAEVLRSSKEQADA